MFADDLALYASHVNPDKACTLLQTGVTAVENWSKINKLDLNLVKSCTYFFTTNNKEAKYRPNLMLEGKRMPFGDGPKELDPTFLGVIIDRSLAFTEHVRHDRQTKDSSSERSRNAHARNDAEQVVSVSGHLHR